MTRNTLPIPTTANAEKIETCDITNMESPLLGLNLKTQMQKNELREYPNEPTRRSKVLYKLECFTLKSLS